MDFKPAITLLGKFAICLLAIFVALMTSNIAISEGGIYAICGALNGAAWIAALVMFFRKYIKPTTDADKYKSTKSE